MILGGSCGRGSSQACVIIVTTARLQGSQCFRKPVAHSIEFVGVCAHTDGRLAAGTCQVHVTVSDVSNRQMWFNQEEFQQVS